MKVYREWIAGVSGLSPLPSPLGLTSRHVRFDVAWHYGVHSHSQRTHFARECTRETCISNFSTRTLSVPTRIVG